MKTKPIPAIITLLAGLVTCIVVFKSGYEVEHGLRTLLAVLIIFYIIGLILRAVLDRVFNSASAGIEQKNQISEQGEENIQEKENKKEPKE